MVEFHTKFSSAFEGRVHKEGKGLLLRENNFGQTRNISKINLLSSHDEHYP